MNSQTRYNEVCLCGTVAAKPEKSHLNRGVPFYTMPLDVARLSGVIDRLNIILPGLIACGTPIEAGMRLCVKGQVRSYNNRTGVGSRLVVSVLARQVEAWEGEDENVVCLMGVLCKSPNLRVTPLGREICDIMLAVNRNYSRADYLPCIAWSESARDIACMDVGDTLSITGRLQSRVYIKNEGEKSVEKTAFEISVLSYAAV